MIILESSFEYPSPTLSSRFKLGRTPTISKVDSAGGGSCGGEYKRYFLKIKNFYFHLLACHFKNCSCLFQRLAKFPLIFEISNPRLALSLLKSLPRFWLVLGQPFYLEKPELWPYDLCWEITLDAPRPYFKLEPLWIGARDNIFRSSFPMDGCLFSGF